MFLENLEENGLENVFENLFFMIGLFALAIIIIILLYLTDKVSMSMLIKNVPNSLGRKIYAYLDKKGKLLNYTPDFFEKININKNKQDKWYKEITDITYKNEKITYNEFQNLFKDSKEKIFNIVLEIDTEIIDLQLEKIAIENEDDIIGYAIISPLEIPKEFDGFLEVMDDLYNPCAYYYGSKEEINFTINRNFQNAINVSANKITYSELRKYVFTEDLEKFDNCTNENYTNIICQYRLITNKGIEQFEETKRFVNDKIVSMITTVELANETYMNSSDLLKCLDNLISQKTGFGAVMLSLNSLLEQSTDLASSNKEIIIKYLQIIKKEILKANDTIARLNDYEYVLVVKDIERFDQIVNNIHKEISSLLVYELDFGNQKIKINNKLGVVYYCDKITTSSEFMNAMNSSLALANDEKYEKNYSIYSPKNKETDKEEYSFEKCQIDLDNSFLHDGE